jgi:hypothetical protein
MSIQIETQPHACFSVNFDVLSKSIINGALEQGYLTLLANPAYLFIAPENMRALLDIVVAGMRDHELRDTRDASVSKWVNQTTGRIISVVPLPDFDQHTIAFGFLKW